MPAKEAKARIKINRLLEEAGWRFFDDATGSVNIQRGKGAKQRYAYIGFRTRKLLSLYLAGRGAAEPTAL